MYNILLAFFDVPQQKQISTICSKQFDINLIICDNPKDIIKHLNQSDINLFMLNLNTSCDFVDNFPEKIRQISRYKFTPIIIFSIKSEIWAINCSNYINCNFLSHKLNSNNKKCFCEFLQYYYNMHHKLCSSSNAFFRINSNCTLHNILIDNILFVESRDRYTVIHTINTSIITHMQLYKIKNSLPPDNFKHTHRSYIVNFNHIEYIDKSSDSWTVRFYNSSEVAFVSRGYKKDLNLYFDKINDIDYNVENTNVENYNFGGY